MRRYLSHTIIPFAVGLLLGAWACATLINTFGAEAPATSVTSIHLEEDDPAWNCFTDGNRICGGAVLSEELRTQAWQAFDEQQAWRQIQVDPSREFRIDIAAASPEPMHAAPGSVVLADRGGMYFQYVVTYP